MITQPTINRQKFVATSDYYLIGSVLALISLGLIMIYSASIAIAESEYGEAGSFHYLTRHASYIIIGLIFGSIVFQIPTRMWRTFVPYLFLSGIILLILVLILELGVKLMGANGGYRSWSSIFSRQNS